MKGYTRPKSSPSPRQSAESYLLYSVFCALQKVNFTHIMRDRELMDLNS